MKFFLFVVVIIVAVSVAALVVAANVLMYWWCLNNVHDAMCTTQAMADLRVVSMIVLGVVTATLASAAWIAQRKADAGSSR